MGGGIPVIAAIDQSLVANQIQSIHGILNGTSNFILTQMEDLSKGLCRCLGRGAKAGLRRGESGDGRQRQRRSAKAGDPGPFVVRLQCRWRMIPRRRHRYIRRGRYAFARELGYTSSFGGGGISARRAGIARFAHARRHGTPLAEVDGAYNAIGWSAMPGRVLLPAWEPVKCQPLRPWLPI